MIMTLLFHRLLFSSITIFFTLDINISHAFCPHLSSRNDEYSDDVKEGHHRDRALYDSLSYFPEGGQTCKNNCFVNDGGNLEAHHQSSDGSTITTFDVMSKLSENDSGTDMCVFSFQELRIPNGEISDTNLLELLYLGDSAGRRMYEFSKSNSDNVLLAACTVGRICANQACSNAKGGVEGYDFFVGDDDSLSGTETHYKNRFCQSAVRNSKIDHPHAITIFRLNSNDVENAEAALEQFRENHATNIQWAYETQIGADGHMLAKVVPCDQISDKFKNPSNMYPNLYDGNSVCDYVGSNGKQYAEEALMEWESLCSVWPLDADGSPPVCHKARAGSAVFITSFVVAVVAAVLLLLHTKKKYTIPLNMDNSELITEMT